MQKDHSVVIGSERLLIRYLLPADAPFILELLNDPSFLTNIGDKGVRTTRDAEDYIHTAGTANYDRYKFGMFLVTESKTGDPIGIAGLLKRDFLEYPDLGFAFMPHVHNQGFGTEAAAALIHWVQAAFEYEQLAAFTSLTNGASIRVLEKVGFRSLGEQDLPGTFGRCHVLNRIL